MQDTFKCIIQAIYSPSHVPEYASHNDKELKSATLTIHTLYSNLKENNMEQRFNNFLYLTGLS